MAEVPRHEPEDKGEEVCPSDRNEGTRSSVQDAIGRSDGKTGTDESRFGTSTALGSQQRSQERCSCGDVKREEEQDGEPDKRTSPTQNVEIASHGRIDVRLGRGHCDDELFRAGKRASPTPAGDVDDSKKKG
jgi:hypothetical protein